MSRIGVAQGGGPEPQGNPGHAGGERGAGDAARGRSGLALTRWAGRNAMPLVAGAGALASIVAIPPDREYLGYFDVGTLALLAILLAVVASLRAGGAFDFAAAVLSRDARTARGATIVLVLASAGCSALFTNDVALLALLPLAAALLGPVGGAGRLALVFVLMTAAANLGGMITPFGSPQNLFLFNRFDFGVAEFMGTMLVPFAVSMAAILPMCLLVPRGPLAEEGSGAEGALPAARTGELAQVTRATVDAPDSVRRTAIVLALFVLTALIVLRVLPLWFLAVVGVALAAVDRRAFVRMDWGLLVTFVAFFVFAGNASRLPGVDAVVSVLLGGGEVLGGALASQVISNVPAAILLAPFSEDHAALLVGVNVGGVGTLVASLASLIALAEFRRARPGETTRFVLTFSWVNATLLALLLAVTLPLQ